MKNYRLCFDIRAGRFAVVLLFCDRDTQNGKYWREKRNGKKFTWIVLSANKMGRDSMLAMEWRKVIERPKYIRLCLNIHLSDIRPFFAIGLNYDKYDERCQSLNIARTGYCIWCHMCEQVSVSFVLSFSMCVHEYDFGLKIPKETHALIR